jgi:hypothetical protein
MALRPSWKKEQQVVEGLAGGDLVALSNMKAGEHV